jgi:DNA-binding CsgD family transcriptional regulator/ArsR family metal-binding transcriptional regulator
METKMFIQGYSDLSITRNYIRNDVVCDLKWGAYFKLNTDVRELFPYVNSTVKDAKYHYRPPHVQFELKSAQCTLYPVEVMAAPFRGRGQVLKFIEGLIVFLNDLYERRSELTPSHKLHRQPPSIVDIVKALPKNNCKKCGYATCMAFAAALRNGETNPSVCPGFANPISVYKVYPAIGKDGAIESTFAIETDAIGKGSKPENTDNGSKGKINKSNRLKKASDLFDRNGIKIQYDLTPREIQVLKLVAEGSSNPEISEMLNISAHTVKSHVIHIFNKLNVNDRTQAAVWAVQNRVI